VSSAKKLRAEEEVSPNLIPMIDIMFLLLLFFMLGADMGQRELEEVILPKATSAQEEKETKGQQTDNRVVVNIFHDNVPCEAYKDNKVCREEKHWRIGIKGKDYTTKTLEGRLKTEGDRLRAAPMEKLSTGQQVPISERPVMVRADASAPFKYVQEVVNACAKVGIYKVECGATLPPKEVVSNLTKQ